MRHRSREELLIDINDVACNICDTDMTWSDDDREWICPKCGNRAFQTEANGIDEICYEFSPDDDYDEYYEEEIEEWVN